MIHSLSSDLIKVLKVTNLTYAHNNFIVIQVHILLEAPFLNAQTA